MSSRKVKKQKKNTKKRDFITSELRSRSKNILSQRLQRSYVRNNTLTCLVIISKFSAFFEKIAKRPCSCHNLLYYHKSSLYCTVSKKSYISLFSIFTKNLLRYREISIFKKYYSNQFSLKVGQQTRH